ncbi:MAG: exo-alpha-sialidase [Planctomycetes bacterium]|nr:exo-alpha-sialidase [Planctomycetota bacterium]
MKDKNFNENYGDDLNSFFILRAFKAQHEVLVNSAAGKPSIAVLPTGEIVLSYIRNYLVSEEKEWMEVIRSVDGGETWSEPIRVTNSTYNDREGYLVMLKDGTLLLCYMRVMSEIDPLHPWHGPFICESKDGGRRWSHPWQVDISKFCPAGPFGCGARGHVVLPDGTFMFFVGTYESPQRPKEYVIISKDGGHTFDAYYQITNMGADSSFTRLQSGKLLGFLRINGADYPRRGAHPDIANLGEKVHFMALTESLDNGKTWSHPVKVTEYNEIPGHILVLKDGNVVVTFGVRHFPLGIQALISHDEGKTWDWDKKILLSWNGSLCRTSNGHVRHSIGHPFSVELPDGKILTSYYRLRDPFDLSSCQVEGLFWNVPK